MTGNAVRSGRNQTIDILRCIGLFLVIAAHCEFPEWFIEFREFDVVLLVFVSGASFYLAGTSRKESYGAYVLRRFRKLVLPVWGFLILFFAFFFLLGRRFSVSEIVQSFLLLAGGVLFIWVYRVFFTTALINPFSRDLAEKYNAMPLACGSLAVLLINDLFSFLAVRFLPSSAGKLFQYIVTYTICYAVMSLLGMCFIKSEQKEKMLFFVLFAIAFLVLGTAMKFPGFYELKYPPTAYYTCYGLAMSAMLYLLFQRVQLNKTTGQGVAWISTNTMTIYMWHIVFFYLLDTLAPEVLDHGLISLVLLFGGGVLGTLVQNEIMKRKGMIRHG